MSDNNSSSDNTNNTAITITYTSGQRTDGTPFAPDDVRGAMSRSVQAARTVIGLLDASNGANPTPCEGWSAQDVASHLLTVFRKAGVAPSGADLMAFPEIADIDLAGLVPALDEAIATMFAAWSDDAALATMINAPWGTMPGAAVLGAWSGETLVHTWDIAVAIGAQLNWPEPDTAVALVRTMAFLPVSGRPEMVPFDDAVVLADDRPAIDRLAGWMGRDVNAWITL